MVPEEGLAVQASVDVSDFSTLERETEALAVLSRRLPVKERLIVTMDDKRDIEVHGAPIKIVPLWEWLLF